MILKNICKILLTLGLTLVAGCATSQPDDKKENATVANYAITQMDADGSAQIDGAVGRGLWVHISVSVSGDGNGHVTATATNNFTLFPSTVPVVVELYYSDNFSTDYNDMTYAGRSYTTDLNMGNSISVAHSTDGEARYWMAVVQYRLDTNDWQYIVSDPTYIDANGNVQ